VSTIAAPVLLLPPQHADNKIEFTATNKNLFISKIPTI
jgi:hypothetical protein